jgi:hypothetical protein
MCALRSHRSRKHSAPNQSAVVQVFTVRETQLKRVNAYERSVWRSRLPIEQPGSGVIFGAVQSGTVIPFPLARRRAFIDRHARLIATMRLEVGERYLDRQLSIQAENLRRKGIPSETIDREVASLGAAIRAAMWQAAWMRGDCR